MTSLKISKKKARRLKRLLLKRIRFGKNEQKYTKTRTIMQTWENTKQEQQQQEYKDVEARAAWARAWKKIFKLRNKLYLQVKNR